MSGIISIRPSKDLRNDDAQISEMEAKLSVYAHLAQAADDIRLGRVQDADEAFDELFGELDALEL